MRALGFYSGGDRPRRINIGGTLGLRGYPQFGYILGSHAFMLNQEIRFPVLTRLDLGTPFGDINLPEIQAGALFADVGKATYPAPAERALLGSYGLGFRLAIAPSRCAAARYRPPLSDEGYRRYSLSREQKRPSFVSFFFGYNY